MINFRELELEYKKLQKIKDKLSHDMKDDPTGKLIVSRTGDKSRYYFRENGDNRRKYISKNEEALIKGLCQKEYNNNLKKFVDKRCMQLSDIIGNYNMLEIDDVYYNLHPDKRKWIIPIEDTWMDFMTIWLENGNECVKNRNVYRAEDLKIMTDTGVMVRSKSEKIIADFLYKNGIPFFYEKPLILGDGKMFFPDFTLLSMKLREEVYFEHFGKMDDQDYFQHTIRKLDTYAQNDIYVGKNLIVSFETMNAPIDMKKIQPQLEWYGVM